MARRSLAMLALSSVALAAQTTTVSLILPLLDKQKLVGSIVDVDSKATTFAIMCPSGVDRTECGLTSSQTIIQGPSTLSMKWIFDSDDGGSLTEDVNCKLNIPKDIATCNVAVDQQYDGTSTSTSLANQVDTGLASVMIPVTITAGVEKLSAASTGAAATADSEATTTAAVPKSSATGEATKTASDGSASDAAVATATSASASSSGTASADSSSSAAAAAATSTDNAAPLATQNAILAGVAALVGGVMML